MIFLSIVIIILLLIIIFNNKIGTAKILEEYRNCFMITIIHYGQKEDWHIVDTSLLKEKGVIGLEIYKQEKPPPDYYEIPIVFDGITLRRVKFFGGNKNGVWFWDFN